MPRPFQGDIQLDVRDSRPDFEAFLGTRAPKGAPNVLVVLYDDTGLAAWSPFGGRIDMPTLEKLAGRGLRPMEAKGQEFDADLHEAITEIEAGDEHRGKVVDEIIKGYYLNDKIIRHAKVVVGR